MLTVTQAAARLGMDARYVRRLVKAGKIRAERVNARLYLITEADLAAYQALPKSKAGRPKKVKD